MKSLMVPVSLAQLVLFGVLMVLFFVFLISALTRRAGETGAKRDNSSRLGIVRQAIGLGVADIEPARVSTGPIDAVGIVSWLAVRLLMGEVIGLVAASS